MNSPLFRWQRVNDEPFEYGIIKDVHGDEFVKLRDGSCLRRPIASVPSTEEGAVPPPLCVWCNAPWTDEMLQVSATADMYHGYYEGDISVESIDATVDVVCSTCNRLVYRKELRKIPFDAQ